MRTILFRPSYYHENYGIKPDEVRVVETATRLGYLTVGVSADPNDWMLTNKPARIAETTIRKIVEGGGAWFSCTIAAAIGRPRSRRCP